MWKLITYLHRRAGSTHAEFDRRWRGSHADLLRAQPAFCAYVRRYVQNHALEDSRSPLRGPDDHDGVSELWFDTLGDLDTALATPAYREVIEPDLAAFVDLGGSGSLVTEEVTVDDRPPAAVKLCAAAFGREGLTREEAQRYWRDEHPRVIRSVPEFMGHVRRYVQNHPRAHAGETIGTLLPYDLALEMFFDSVEEMQAAFTEPAYLTTVRADEARFARVDGTLALVTSESIVLERGR